MPLQIRSYVTADYAWMCEMYGALYPDSATSRVELCYNSAPEFSLPLS